MHPGVHEEAKIVQFDEPGTGANIRIGVQIYDSHTVSRQKNAKNRPKKQLKAAEKGKKGVVLPIGKAQKTLEIQGKSVKMCLSPNRLQKSLK
jgi:hypothetical protein